MQFIDGGVCAPQGFRAAGVYAGVKAAAGMTAAEAAKFSEEIRSGKRPAESKSDAALIAADGPCAAAGVFTSNLVKGAPIAVCQTNLQNGRAQAIFANSGNANTCNVDGQDKAWKMAQAAADALGIAADDVLVASTGVIGVPLPIGPLVAAAPALASKLSSHGSLDAATAIMTTDRVPKNLAVEFTVGGRTAHIGGISKGSGMIHPNMCTMLCFLTTDVAIAPSMLDRALRLAVRDSFNMLSVDEDMSTNDTCVILANGRAGNAEITAAGPEFDAFTEALSALCIQLARAMAKDGEGATKLLVCAVAGGKTDKDARTVAKAVICSSLVKTAIFGADANWGRVLCAIGYCGAQVDVHQVDVDFVSKGGRLAVCRNGAGIPFDEALGKQVLQEDEITVEVTLHAGSAAATAFGCDLTYDYVKINGDYRT